MLTRRYMVALHPITLMAAQEMESGSSVVQSRGLKSTRDQERIGERRAFAKFGRGRGRMHVRRRKIGENNLYEVNLTEFENFLEYM
jgi:hypothetical protein